MDNGIYVVIKESAYILDKIQALSEKYNRYKSFSGRYEDARKNLRCYCHETLCLINECFETSLLGMRRCLAKIKGYEIRDEVPIQVATLDIFGILCDLRNIVINAIPIKDLPSCKKLTELSSEDVISKAKDLIKNDIVKDSARIILLGSDVCKVVKIENVRSYYQNSLKELQRELLEKGEAPSPMEQFLLDKYEAELGYCDIASFKTGVSIAKEALDLAKSNIERYERRALTDNSDSLPINLQLRT